MILDLPIKYALFDMDGTLTDTMRFWRGCLNEFLFDAEGILLGEREIERLETMSFEKGIAYIRSLGISKKIDSFGIDDVLRILKAHYESEAVAKAGVRELLDELKEKDVKMAVATLTPSPLAEICLAKTGLRSYFEFVFGGESYPEGKTQPRIFLDAAKRLGCEKEEMYLFEDSLYSIKTAVSLGIPIVGVADRYQERERPAIMEASHAFFEDGFLTRIK